jgi:hypothetical protein
MLFRFLTGLFKRRTKPEIQEEEKPSSLTDFYKRTSYFQSSEKDLLSAISDPGALGELQLCNELDKIKSYKKILVNMYLQNRASGSSETDVICVTQKGIFVIEYKNYSGSIYGQGQYKNWLYYSGKGNTPIEFYSPVRQNQSHIRAILQNFPQLDPDWLISIVVFSNRCTLKISDVSVPAVHRGDILPTIESIMAERANCFTIEEVDSFAEGFLSFCNQPNSVREEHINYVKRFQRSGSSE